MSVRFSLGKFTMLALACALAGCVLVAEAAYAGDAGSAMIAAAETDAAGLASGSAGGQAAPTASLQLRARSEKAGLGSWSTAAAGSAAKSGTTGKGGRLRTVELKLDSSLVGSVQYQALVNGAGWQGLKADGAVAGSTAGSGWMKAIRVRLAGDVAQRFDVEYRAYVKGSGWCPWVFNGATSGTTKKGGSMTALQVKLVERGREASLSDGTYAITLSGDASKGLSVSGQSVKKAAFSAKKAAGKFYVRNERGGVTLQSVSSGKFLAAGGALKLTSWSASDSLVWLATSDGGLRLSNKATGARLELSGSEAALGATGGTFAFTPVNLVNDGSYVFTNAAKSKVLDIDGMSWSNGANAQLRKRAGTGNQVFTLKNGGNWCTIKNTVNGKALEVAGGSKKQGANVRQWKSKGSASQQWKACLSRSGALYFVNRASGKALTAAGKGKSGANVSSSKYKASKVQHWKLKAKKWTLTGSKSLDKYVMKIVGSCHGDLRRCFNWMGRLRHVQSVDSRIHHGIMGKAVVNSYVRIAKKRGVADCYTDAALFCCLARGCGYKANMRAGGCPSASRGTVPHGWTEVYLNGTTYVCDANLNRDLPSYNWYMVTYASAPVSYSF